MTGGRLPLVRTRSLPGDGSPSRREIGEDCRKETARKHRFRDDRFARSGRFGPRDQAGRAGIGSGGGGTGRNRQGTSRAHGYWRGAPVPFGSVAEGVDEVLEDSTAISGTDDRWRLRRAAERIAARRHRPDLRRVAISRAGRRTRSGASDIRSPSHACRQASSSCGKAGRIGR